MYSFQFYLSYRISENGIQQTTKTNLCQFSSQIIVPGSQLQEIFLFRKFVTSRAKMMHGEMLTYSDCYELANN